MKGRIEAKRISSWTLPRASTSTVYALEIALQHGLEAEFTQGAAQPVLASIDGCFDIHAFELEFRYLPEITPEMGSCLAESVLADVGDLDVKAVEAVVESVGLHQSELFSAEIPANSQWFETVVALNFPRQDLWVLEVQIEEGIDEADRVQDLGFEVGSGYQQVEGGFVADQEAPFTVEYIAAQGWYPLFRNAISIGPGPVIVTHDDLQVEQAGHEDYQAEDNENPQRGESFLEVGEVGVLVNGHDRRVEPEELFLSSGADSAPDLDP